MKKFFVPLFLLLSCSNEEIKPNENAASEQKNGPCFVKNSDGHSGDFYKNISKELCEQIGGTPDDHCPDETGFICNTGASSSSVSSSSRITSSSSVGGTGSSSSSRITSSSSVGGTGSSSSGGTGSSSSGGVAGSSSSVGAGSSSSVIAGSSSSIGNLSSSSIGVSSSSSLASPILDTTAFCTSFPNYVAKYVTGTTPKKEYIKNLFSLEGDDSGCGTISYSVSSTGGSGNTNTASISGDSISFANYSVSSTTKRNSIITASVKCGARTQTVECPIEVYVAADKFAKVSLCDTKVPVLGTTASPATVVEISCRKDNGSLPDKFGCDNKEGNFTSATDVFTLNGSPAASSSYPNGWADADIPANIVDKDIKRILINYNKEMACAAH